MTIKIVIGTYLVQTPVIALPRLSVDQEFHLAIAQAQKTFESSAPHQKSLILQSLTPVRNGNVPTIKVFDVAKTVGRPKDNSTRRELSGFEIAHGPTMSRKRALKRNPETKVGSSAPVGQPLITNPMEGEIASDLEVGEASVTGERPNLDLLKKGDDLQFCWLQS